MKEFEDLKIRGLDNLIIRQWEDLKMAISRDDKTLFILFNLSSQ